MSDYSTTATVVLDVNGTKAKEAINSQISHVKQLEEAYAKALSGGDAKSLKKVESELKKARRELKSMQSEAANVADVLNRLDQATPKELKNTLKTLNAQLSKMERGTRQWAEQTEKIKRVKSELDLVNKELRSQESIWHRLNNTVNNWGASILAAIGALSGLVFSARKAVEDFAAMDQEMANVRKFTGMTAEEVAALNVEFKKIDTRTSREGLNQLAQEAGRLGKTSQEDVLGFVRAADQINVALDDLGRDATVTLSKLTGIFGDEKRLGTEKALLSVGSVINDLSQNCTASAPYLAEFASRMGGVGVQANLTIPQIMAFGAVLDSNNQNVEASATALSQVITRLYQDPAKYAKAAGLDAQEFAKIVKEDMNLALITLLERLNSLGSMDALAPIFKDMGENGARAISSLSTLASKIEDVKSQQEVATQSFEDATSVTKEFTVQNTTVQASLDKAKNRFHELSVQLGEKLLPVMRYTITTSSAIVRSLSVLIDFFVEYKREILLVSSTIAAYTLVIKANVMWTNACAAATKTVSALALLGKSAIQLLSAAYFGLTGQIRKADVMLKGFSATLKLNPIGLIVSALSLAVGSVIIYTQKLRESRKAQEEARKEAELYKKSLTDIGETASQSASKELARAKMLYDVATDEAASRDKRVEAVNKLKEQYPEFFAAIDTEIILTGKAQSQYDSLAESILKVARAKAAASKIEENQSKLLDLEREKSDQENRIEALKTRMSNARSEMNNPKSVATIDDKTWVPGKGGLYAALSARHDYDAANKELKAAAEKLKETQRAIAEIEEANAWLEEQYNASSVVVEDTPTSQVNIPPLSDTSDTSSSVSAEDTWRDEQLARNRIAYAVGEKDYEEYVSAREQIEIEAIERSLQRTDLSNKDRLELEASLAEAKNKIFDRSVEEENARYNEAVAYEKQRYIDGQTSLEAHNSALQLMELDHMRRLVQCTREGSQERIDAEKAYNAAVLADAEKRHAAYLAEETKHQQELAQIKSRVFGLSDEEKFQGYTSDLSNLTEVYEAEVAAANGNKERLLQIEEAFHNARLQLKEKWDQKIDKADMSAKDRLQAANDKFLSWLETEQGQAFTKSLNFLNSSMSSILSSLTSLVQAELDIQTAEIEKKYDREIELAGDNSALVAELEKKKEQDIAKAKNEANKKMFAMQVIQAIAQTAQGAIAAYASAAAIPLVGWIMGPIAAAMAVAAGMIQVATIKKQQQASEAQGYARGGFTKPGKKYEPAGIVHAGEWVASQELLASPTARAMIDTLDYAQRTNTIGALSGRDVSTVLSSPVRMAAANGDTSLASVVATQADMIGRYTVVMERLSKRLDEPFVTINTVSGDTGIKQAQDKYNKLINNKTKRP